MDFIDDTPIIAKTKKVVSETNGEAEFICSGNKLEHKGTLS